MVYGNSWLLDRFLSCILHLSLNCDSLATVLFSVLPFLCSTLIELQVSNGWTGLIINIVVVLRLFLNFLFLWTKDSRSQTAGFLKTGSASFFPCFFFMMVILAEIVQEGRKRILKSFFRICFHVTAFFAMTTYSKML